jgi:hypothetical protein
VATAHDGEKPVVLLAPPPLAGREPGARVGVDRAEEQSAARRQSCARSARPMPVPLAIAPGRRLETNETSASNWCWLSVLAIGSAST